MLKEVLLLYQGLGVNGEDAQQDGLHGLNAL
jgi:hypothetical protein